MSDTSELIVSVGTTALRGINNEEIILYPNPFSESLTIQFPNPDHDAYRLTLTDMSGREVRVLENITEEKIRLSRDGLPEGFYIVELRGSLLFKYIITVQ